MLKISGLLAQVRVFSGFRIVYRRLLTLERRDCVSTLERWNQRPTLNLRQTSQGH